MRLGSSLSAGWRRLRRSGVLWPLLAWSALSLLSFYWPSQWLLAPWLPQLSAMTDADLHSLQAIALTLQRSGAMGPLLAMLGLRVLLSPAVDALVYQRLVATGSWRTAALRFYRLHLLLWLGGLLFGWLLYFRSGWYWRVLAEPPLLVGLALLLPLVAYGCGLALSFYKAGLVSSEQRPAWPRLAGWWRAACAQGCLSLLFAAALAILSQAAWLQQGWLLLPLLLLTGVVRATGRLWKISVAVCLWQAE